MLNFNTENLDTVLKPIRFFPVSSMLPVQFHFPVCQHTQVVATKPRPRGGQGLGAADVLGASRPVWV